jgi:hypothetical protein
MCGSRVSPTHAQTKDAVILPSVLLDKGIGCQRRVKAGVADKFRIEPFMSETHRWRMNQSICQIGVA